MDIHEAAAALDGSEYREEGSRELFDQMKKAGLIAVFGASDDIVELRGAEHDEHGPGTLNFTPDGLLRNDCEDRHCPYFAKLERLAASVTTVWDDGSGYSWRYKTDIPHSTFTVKDDGDLYCEGIVFALKDAHKRAV